MIDMPIFWAICGYLLGSVPFGLVITRLFGLGDLRQIGSGNIGATNVLRTGNKTAAFLTLICDSGKGAAAVLIARWIAGADMGLIAGVAAFVGHIYPIWLRFRGGKGVATFLGTTLAMHWPLGFIACGAWLMTAGVSRISSLSALVAAAVAPFAAILMGSWSLALASVAMGFLIVWRHRENIIRIRAGTEPKIGEGR